MHKNFVALLFRFCCRYEMLLECWNISRPSRPRFAILREFFGEESKQFRVDISQDSSVNNYTNV